MFTAVNCHIGFIVEQCANQGAVLGNDDLQEDRLCLNAIGTGYVLTSPRSIALMVHNGYTRKGRSDIC